MHVNDQSYKAFVTWIQDYANVVDNKYTSVEDLPADNWVPTQKVLRLTDVPEDWGDLAVVQLVVHRQSDQPGGWSREPIAFTQSLVTPRRMVMGPLSLFRAGSDQHNNKTGAGLLKPGRYLVRAYVDKQKKINHAPSLLLGTEDFVGESEIEAQWRIGFKQAEVMSAANLSK